MPSAPPVFNMRSTRLVRGINPILSAILRASRAPMPAALAVAKNLSRALPKDADARAGSSMFLATSTALRPTSRNASRLFNAAAEFPCHCPPVSRKTSFIARSDWVSLSAAACASISPIISANTPVKSRIDMAASFAPALVRVNPVVNKSRSAAACRALISPANSTCNFSASRFFGAWIAA